MIESNTFVVGTGCQSNFDRDRFVCLVNSGRS